jgi:hypothetical protein
MIEEIEVSRIADGFFKIGTSEIRLVEGNLVHVKAMGPASLQLALAHVKLYRQLSEEIGGSLRYAIDLNKAGKSTAEARKIWMGVSEDISTYKVALIGVHPVAKVLAGFFMCVTSNKKIQFFDSFDKAFKWLKD